MQLLFFGVCVLFLIFLRGAFTFIKHCRMIQDATLQEWGLSPQAALRTQRKHTTAEKSQQTTAVQFQTSLERTLEKALRVLGSCNTWRCEGGWWSWWGFSCSHLPHLVVMATQQEVEVFGNLSKRRKGIKGWRQAQPSMGLPWPAFRTNRYGIVRPDLDALLAKSKNTAGGRMICLSSHSQISQLWE